MLQEWVSRHILESAASASTKSAAGEAASTSTSATPSRAAGAGTRSRNKGRTGSMGHGAQAVHKIKRGEHVAVRRLVPRGWVLDDPFNCLGPVVLHAQGHGVGKEFFKSIRRHALEPVSIHAVHELLEAF